MSKQIKIIIMIVLIGIIGCFIYIQTAKVYNNIYRIRSAHQSRDQEIRIQGWMTVKEVSQRTKLPEKEIFNALEIVPAPGDEQLSLRALRKKYNLDQQQMQNRLQHLIKKKKPIGGPNE